MKSLMTSKILMKTLIFAFLLAGLFVVANDSQFAPVSRAAPCCSQCPVPPGGDEGEYCADQCGASSGTCFNSCVRQAQNCLRVCYFDC